jgi:SagB-type dehydrogenase family enzyme
MKQNLITIIAILGLSAAISISAEPNAVLRTLPLPQPQTSGEFSIEQILAAGRNVTQFTQETITIDKISQLLWAGQGIIDANSGQRTVPSFATVEPIQLYVIIRGGIYSYDSQKHNLTKIYDGDIREKLAAAAYSNSILEKAPCSIVITGTTQLPAKQYLYLEAGHIAQNIQLQGIALGIACLPVGNFDAVKVMQLWQIPAGQAPIYIVAAGYPPKEQAFRMEAIKKTQDAQSSLVLPPKKRAVVILPEERFIDGELFDALDVLSIAGIEVDIAGVTIETYKGEDRGIIQATKLIRDISIVDYNAIVLVSGISTNALHKDTILLSLLVQAKNQNKVIAAIGKSARMLGESGVVRGYRVTGDLSASSSLRKAGGIFINSTAERDKNIVTAQGADYSTQFGRLIAEALTGVESRPATSGRYVDPRVRQRQGQTR